MRKLRKSIKWLLRAAAIFAAFVLGFALGDNRIDARRCLAAAMITGFLVLNDSLPLQWSARQRFAVRFGYVFLSMPAVLLYFDDSFTWMRCILMPFGIAFTMVATFGMGDLKRQKSHRNPTPPHPRQPETS